MKDPQHSDYWLDNSSLDEDTNDVIALSIHRRAISNFVSILTGKDIPVRFKVKGDSFTTGDFVQLSADITKDGHDIAVGTALHEASHILLSNFELLHNLFNMIPRNILDAGARLNVDKLTISDITKNIWNYVEDRYIDTMTYKSAPGYRGYYRAMYNEYWDSPSISKVLKSDEYRDADVNSYLFRIINLTNQATDLNALPGLRDIVKEIGFSDMERLSDPMNRFDVAFKVVEIIFDNMSPNKKSKPQYFSIFETNDDASSPTNTLRDETWPTKFDDSDDETEGDSDSDDDEGEGIPSNGDEDESSDSDGFDLFGGIVNELEGLDENSTQEESDIPSVSDNVLTRAERDFQRIKDFMNREREIKEISIETSNVLDTIEEAKTEMVSVGAGSNSINCIVVNNLTKRFLQSGTSGLHTQTDKIHTYSSAERGVETGLRMGRLLGKKLKIRGESRSTLFTRKANGKIDPRLISELGFGNANVFSKLEIDQYKDAFVHITIDASGSMSGSKFEKTMASAVAIAKAASMIPNLEVVISFRTQTTYQHPLPMIVIGYDSRKDKIQKIKNLFPCLHVQAFTPEGLCFEAIASQIPHSTPTQDSYFLNFSDGEPYFYVDGFDYSGTSACNHTQKQVKRIISKGVEVISYFVGESDRGINMGQFKKMYDRNSHFIDVTNVSQVAKTMNRKFLSKN